MFSGLFRADDIKVHIAEEDLADFVADVNRLSKGLRQRTTWHLRPCAWNLLPPATRDKSRYNSAMKLIRLPVVLTPGEDGYIVAEIPVIPGCISQGRTEEEALANIREAAEVCLENREAEGWQLPASYSVEEIEVSA